MSPTKSMTEIQETSRSSYRQFIVVIPGVLFSIFILLQYVFTDDFYMAGRHVLLLTIPLSIIFSILQMVDKKATPVRRVIYSAFFHSILSLFLIFAAPQSSGYIFAWVLLIYALQVDKRNRAVFYSYGALVITQFLALLYRDQLSAGPMINSVIKLSLIVIISQLMLQAKAGEERELDALQNSLDRELFERQRLLSLINSLGEAVIATDAKGMVLLYNAAVLNLLDTNSSLENQKLDDFLHLKSKLGKKVKILSLLKNELNGVTSSDYTHEYAKNDVINLYINIAPIRLGFKQNSESGFIIILRDVTKQKSLEEERDEFISVVSHELRTPVAIAEGNISNAQFMNTAKNDPEITAQSLEQAHKQVVFLANMINDLATLSRAERTDIEVEITKVDPASMLRSMGEDYKKQVQAKNLKLSVSTAKDTKELFTSELYLREILQNFITNSVKYTKKGGLILHVRSNKNGDAVFSIADTGIGLSKADQTRIFEKFFRSEDYRTRESAGTGLGLYVTSKLAHRLGATISVESTLNKGSTFTITCPSMGEPKTHSNNK